MNVKSKYLICLDREIHYMDWAEEKTEVAILWHGFARTGRDMDELASYLSSRYRVICPDTIGRGLSQWSPSPKAEYCIGFYTQLAVALVDQLGLKTFHWVGTSMGGAIGLHAASGPLKGRISRLVMNDMGTKVADAAADRIRSYAGKPPIFNRVTELETYFRTIYKPYGYLSDREWVKMAETSVRRMADGGITPHYDPNIVQQFECYPNDYDQMPAYERIDIPVLVLRGQESDLLLKENAKEMQRRGPKAKVVEIAGCGHAPALNVPEQLNLVSSFLAG